MAENQPPEQPPRDARVAPPAAPNVSPRDVAPVEEPPRENEIESPPPRRVEPLAPATPCDDSARDIAVDLVKLFITFATAAIAFLVGAVFTGKIVLGALTVEFCLLFFAASVVCGLLFFMNAVDGLHVGGYRVTQRTPVVLAVFQIVLFLAGAAWLGVQAIKRARSPLLPLPITQIEIQATGGRWSVDSVAHIGIHKDRSSRDSGVVLRLRAVSDGLTLRISVDTAARTPR